MRILSVDEQTKVSGGLGGWSDDEPMEEVTVTGKRPRKKDPFQGFAELHGYDIGTSAIQYYGGGGGGGGETMQEVVVEAQKILSDNLKVDLGKCGIPIDLLLNPHDKIDSADYWKSCFETLTAEDLKNLADAFKELSKLISDRKLATAVSGNWIKQCIIAIESGNGGWFGQNYFDLLGSAALGGLFGQALKTITKR